MAWHILVGKIKGIIQRFFTFVRKLFKKEDIYIIMEFHIRKGATKPVLKLRLVDDGKNDKSSYNEDLLNAVVTFEMMDVSNGVYKTLNGTCGITTRTKKYNNVTDEYYIIYQFTSNDTSELGRYEGTVTIQFRDTDLNDTYKLIIPIQEKLYINVV